MEPELIDVETQALVLIMNEDIDRVNTQVRTVSICAFARAVRPGGNRGGVHASDYTRAGKAMIRLVDSRLNKCLPWLAPIGSNHIGPPAVSCTFIGNGWGSSELRPFAFASPCCLPRLAFGKPDISLDLANR